MQAKKRIKRLEDYGLITLAAVFYGMGISLFLDPCNISPGGITGVAMIFSRMIPLQTGTLYFLINIPILIVGVCKLGGSFLIKTMYSVLATSLCVNVFAPLGAVTEDLLLSSLAGGILLAIGIGLIFRAGGATGGTDIIVRLLRLRYRHLKAGFLLLCLDALVVGATGLLLHNINLTLYALLTVFVSDKAVDYIIYGSDEAKLFHIITNHHQIIAKRLMNELEVGCTFLEGKGAWSGTTKEIMLVVVQKRMGPKVEEIVRMEDAQAFIIESKASEIYGEGYKNLLLLE
ncbi:MAG: YitT family protein [Lachnospiraceae bacterium]|nr:YitT family protein [Lachnospiraceae bacterium]